jgi:hypothetical protein
MPAKALWIALLPEAVGICSAINFPSEVYKEARPTESPLLTKEPKTAFVESIAFFAAARSKDFISFSVVVFVPDSAVLLLQAINKDVIEKITRTVSSCFIKNFLGGKIVMMKGTVFQINRGIKN